MALVSAVVMAHPKRQHLIPYLWDELGDVAVVWDQLGDRWHTGRRAMAAFDPAAEWHLVVQDDAILCRDFLAGAGAVLKHAPAGPVSFYTGGYSPHAVEVERAVQETKRRGAHYLLMEGPHWGVAVAVPTVLIPEMLRGCEALKGVDNYDMRLQRYFTSRGYRCRYTIPSLANHRVGERNPSLVQGRGNSLGRTAHEWIGDRSATEIDWGAGETYEASETPTRRRNGMSNRRIATRRTYGRDAKGRAVLIAAKGQPLPAWYVDDDEAGLPSPASREKLIASQNLQGLTYPELQKLVKARGLTPAGRKKTDLINALS